MEDLKEQVGVMTLNQGSVNSNSKHLKDILLELLGKMGYFGEWKTVLTMPL